jgi:peptide/nickel transport system permease protein
MAHSNPSLLAGSIMVGVVVITALFGPLLQRYPAEVPNPLQSLRPPSLQHWFGTDGSGFDVYSRVVAAARVDLLIGLTGTLVAMTIGGIIGIVVGFSRGFGDTLVSRGVDLLQSIPLFIAALMFVMLFGQRTSNVIAAMTLVYLPLYVRTFRAETRAVMERGFMRSARISGATNRSLAIRHVVPNAMPPALGLWATSVGWSILITAGLGFVGAGLKPPTAEWGSMISDGASFVVTGQWWVALFPGLAIVFTVAAFTLLSDGLQHALDPRQRR